MNLPQSMIEAAQQAFLDGRLTAVDLVTGCMERIAACDGELHAVLGLNPGALEQARQLDQDLARTGRLTGPLHGIPVVIKDNFHSSEMPAQAGAVALPDRVGTMDSTVVRRLREAGAIMLARTNMHELALAGTTVSSLGGQTLNPYDLSRTPGGSSGGTGAALAAAYGLIGLGTDTVNSIRSPASANCLVGLRPTHGLVSRHHVVPVCETQDTAGALTLTVRDSARVLDIIAGFDLGDPLTARAWGQPVGAYEAALEQASLKGVRLGVMRSLFGRDAASEPVNRCMDQAMGLLREQGAVLVDIDDSAFDSAAIIRDYDVQRWEFRELFDDYLQQRALPGMSSLSEFIADGRFHRPDLETFLQQANAVKNRWDDAEYLRRLAAMGRLRDRLLWLMATHDVQAVIYPLQQCLVVPADGTAQVARNGIVAAVTGLPAINLPAGFSEPDESAPIGVPVGMDILGRPFDEIRLLQLAAAFERVAAVHRPPRGVAFFPELLGSS